MKFLMAVICTIASMPVFSQARIRNNDVRQGDSAILFRGVVNHFEIGEEKDSYRRVVSVNKGSLAIVGANHYLLRSGDADTVTIRVFLGVGNKQYEVRKLSLQVQETGNRSVELVEEKDRTLSNGQLWNETRLEVRFGNPNYAGEWEVAHFEISLLDTSGKVVLPPTFVSGKRLGKEVWDRVAALPAGSTVVFSQVVLTYPNGGYFQHDDFTLRKK